MFSKISTMYFSPTGTTKRVSTAIAAELGQLSGNSTVMTEIDFSLPEVRKKSFSFDADDFVIVGIPVYAGRVPNVLLKFLGTIAGGGAKAAAVVSYGNRNYDDALIELVDILEAQGFSVIAAGAFIGEHSFSTILAANRPDADDLAIARNFADCIHAKLIGGDVASPVAVNGQKPYRPYYVPKNELGEPVHDFRKIKPLTNNNCSDCKICARICPVGSIEYDNVAEISGICIKCCACIKGCPDKAKYFDDPSYERHRIELEINFAERKEPELFL